MDFLTSISWSNPSWDLFIVLLFIVSAFLYGLSLGRDRILVILTSIYMALAIVNTAPYLEGFSLRVSINGNETLNITVFLGIFVALFFLMGRTAIVNTFAGDNNGKWWHALIFSFFHTGLILSIVLQYLNEDTLQYISEAMRNYFISEPAKFFWLVGPIISMVVLGGKEDND